MSNNNDNITVLAERVEEKKYTIVEMWEFAIPMNSRFLKSSEDNVHCGYYVCSYPNCTCYER